MESEKTAPTKLVPNLNIALIAYKADNISGGSSIEKPKEIPRKNHFKLPKLPNEKPLNRSMDNAPSANRSPARNTLPTIASSAVVPVRDEFVSDSLNKLQNFLVEDPKKIEGKEIPKRRKGHKTRFKLKKTTQESREGLQQLILGYIKKQKFYLSNNLMPLTNVPKNSLPIDSLKFVESLLTKKNIVKDKFGLDSDNLKKNNLVLEEIMLQRLEMRSLNAQKVKATNEVLRVDRRSTGAQEGEAKPPGV
eukprot:TRINITY_DN10795_c0_g1_i1.p1 TRINITY_DN10795_c0_g1~~TRINITY_DN10795_c0_g1_i1.p1  ORF type:complete len:249 (+),score=52.97 TRINITY_DN10795_c0_g1_i1:68-814(+)